ncbi:MAG: hypothetical protein Q8L60_08400 [Gammaproteobacteria bacterium]|nr:hypothetical protein [Gammaproteobacteria bacterium]MDP2139191.1 hypothetical protein [Gammaproteobacteria bacterium]MDP2349040.1 hypothetical protein [Gammaproteobacteria bacterium]
MLGKLKTAILTTILAFTLAACGFVTAPLRHGIARTAQFGLQGVDAVIVHNRGAAEIVAEPATPDTSVAESLPPEQVNPETLNGARTYPSPPR